MRKPLVLVRCNARVKWLPYAFALLAGAAYLGLGSALETYGRGLGASRGPSIASFLGLTFGFQVPLLRKGVQSAPKLWVWPLCVGFLVLSSLCEALIKSSYRQDAPFATYLWLGTLDLTLGLAIFFLMIPLGEVTFRSVDLRAETEKAE